MSPTDPPEPTAAPAGPPGPFLPSESPWPNRVVWASAAGAVLCLGVWQAGLWEVELTNPPAGTLAERIDNDPDAGLGEPIDAVAEAAALDWGEEWDPGAGLDPGPVAVAEDVPADADPADELPADGDAFDLLAAADPGADDADPWGGDPVAFDPPAAPDPPTAAGPEEPAGFWADEPAVAVAPIPDPAAEPPGGVFAPPPTPPAAAPPAAAVADAAAPGAVADRDPFAPADPPVRVASASSATAGPVVTADGGDPFGPVEAPKETPPEPAVPGPPVDLSAALLEAVDAALAAGEVLEAHAALSRLWWDEPNVRPAIRGRLDGTARQIYFDAASHFMTPRTVQAGETLADVAADLSVPPMYLARVNRVAPASVTAGTELKVIRGPFGAAVDRSAGTLTVHAHGYFVRAFPCRTAGVAPGEYAVGAKARTGGGARLLLTAGDGEPVPLAAGRDFSAENPGLSLAGPDADQLFDLLTVGGTISVRP